MMLAVEVVVVVGEQVRMISLEPMRMMEEEEPERMQVRLTFWKRFGEVEVEHRRLSSWLQETGI